MCYIRLMPVYLTLQCLLHFLSPFISSHPSHCVMSRRGHGHSSNVSDHHPSDAPLEISAPSQLSTSTKPCSHSAGRRRRRRRRIHNFTSTMAMAMQFGVQWSFLLTLICCCCCILALGDPLDQRAESVTHACTPSLRISFFKFLLGVSCKFSVDFFVCLAVYLFVDAFAFCVGRILFSILEFWDFGFWISKGRWFAEPISANVLLGVMRRVLEVL